MMEFIKRHAFLLVLGAGFVVIAAVVLVTVQFGYRGPGSALEAKLARTEGAARNLLGSPLYGQKLIEQMSAEVKQREARYEEILDYLRKLGQARKPLVEGLFPRSTDVNLRHSFKAEYDPALDRFMKTLGAILPLLPQDTPEAEKAGRLKKFEQATMFAHPQQSFVRPDWVDKAEAPTLDQCAVAQEDLWLMSDLVGILAEINRDSLAGPTPVIRNVPIKELVEIRIGAGVATLEGSRGGGGRGSVSSVVRPGGWGRGSHGVGPALQARVLPRPAVPPGGGDRIAVVGRTAAPAQGDREFSERGSVAHEADRAGNVRTVPGEPPGVLAGGVRERRGGAAGGGRRVAGFPVCGRTGDEPAANSRGAGGAGAGRLIFEGLSAGPRLPTPGDPG